MVRVRLTLKWRVAIRDYIEFKAEMWCTLGTAGLWQTAKARCQDPMSGTILLIYNLLYKINMNQLRSIINELPLF